MTTATIVETPVAILRTRREWDALGTTIALNTRPASTEMRDGKEVALFRQDQGRPKLQPGEACNWSFDLVRLPSNLEWVHQQFDLASHYAMVLRKIELERRRDCDDLMRKMFPEYAALMRDIDAAEKTFRDLISAVRAENQRVRQRVDTEDQKQAIAEARKTRASLYEQRTKLVKTLYADQSYKDAVKPIDDLAKSQSARARCKARQDGLGWGTCGSVDEGARDLRKGPPPNLRREGADSLYTQMQATTGKPPLTWERMLSGQDTRIRAALNGKLAVVSVRLGGEGRDGEWVDCAFMMHRSINGQQVRGNKNKRGTPGLPIGTVVKGVRLCRRTVGYRDAWSIVFTLERRGGFGSPPRAESGTVAVDVGYRKLPHGVRVAYWVGGDGRHGEVVIPEGRGKGLPPRQNEQDLLTDFAGNGCGNAVGYYLYARQLQSIRDENFTRMILALGEWCAVRKDTLPDWLAQEAAVLHAIRSKERLLDLFDHWSSNRFADDDAGFAILSDWRQWRDSEGMTHGELHLAKWEAESRAKFARWRKDYYSRFWATLRNQYATVVFEDMKLSELRNGNPDPDEEATHGDDYANMASLYLFRQLGGYLGKKQRTDAGTVYVDPKDTTATCWKCGKLCEWDQAKHLRHRCEWCGAEWDQDFSAAKNLLQCATGEVIADDE